MNTRIHDEKIYQLVNAANNGDFLMIKTLLKNGAPVNGIYDNRISALAMAVQNGHLLIAEELLKSGADINFELEGQQLLWIAAFSKNVGMVRLLIKHGAPLNKIQSHNGSTPLFVATFNQDYDTAKVLIDAGCDVNISHLFSGESPLSYAALTSQYKMVKELIKAGAEINAVNIKGETPIFSAIQGKSIPIITAILHAGADINHTSPIGRTALSFAHQFFPAMAEIVREESNLSYDISQARIINQAILYYEKMNKKFPEIYNIDDVNEISSGLCAGLGLYFAIINGEEKKQFIAQMKLVDEWSGDIETVCDKLKQIFEIKLAIIMWLHVTICLSPDLKQLLKKLKYDTSKLVNFILMDHHDNYQQIFSIGFVFKRLEIKNILMRLLRDGIKVLLSANHHKISLRKVSDSKYIYDANSSIGELTVASIDDLVDKIILMFEHNKYKPYIGLNIEAICKIDLYSKHEFNEIKNNFVTALLKDREQRNEIDIKDSNTSLTSLDYAVLAQDKKLVIALIELGASVNHEDTESTALTLAAQTGNVDIADYLIARGADVNAKVTEKLQESNALAIAISYRFSDMVDLLLKHGADANMKLEGHLTALHLAAQSRNVKIMNKLIQYGADIEGKATQESCTPLFVAVVKNSVDMIKILLEKYADYDHPCYKNGELYSTPLSVAVHLNRLDIVKLFVEYGADLNVPICKNVLPVNLTDNKEMISYIMERIKITNTKTRNANPSSANGHRKNNMFSYKASQHHREDTTSNQEIVLRNTSQQQ